MKLWAGIIVFLLIGLPNIGNAGRWSLDVTDYQTRETKRYALLNDKDWSGQFTVDGHLWICQSPAQVVKAHIANGRAVAFRDLFCVSSIRKVWAGTTVSGYHDGSEFESGILKLGNDILKPDFVLYLTYNSSY